MRRLFLQNSLHAQVVLNGGSRCHLWLKYKGKVRLFALTKMWKMWGFLILVVAVALALAVVVSTWRRNLFFCSSSCSTSHITSSSSTASSSSSSSSSSQCATGNGICGIQVIREQLLGGPLSAGMHVSTSVTCPTGTTLIGGGATVVETGAVQGQIVALAASTPTGPFNQPPDSILGSIVVISGPANAGVEVCAICAEIC
jgi:hypothetical protein